MNTKKLLIEQNNIAVAVMKTGDYNRAISILYATLKAHRQSITLCEMINNDASAGADESNIDKCILESKRNYAFEEEGNEQYMHSQGIFLLPKLNSKFIPLAIIFNLALAYNLSAPQSTQKRQLLEKATTLYELAYNSVREASAANALFTLATLNNLGLIHKELGQSEKSSKCFDNLLCLVMFLVDSKICHHLDYIDAFLRNITIASSKAFPAAAA